MKKIVFTLVVCLTLFSGTLFSQEQEYCSNSDSLRLVAVALSRGIEYKRLYQEQLGITTIQDSIIVNLNKDKFELLDELLKKPTEVTKHNWLITGIITTTVVLIQSLLTIFILK